MDKKIPIIIGSIIGGALLLIISTKKAGSTVTEAVETAIDDTEEVVASVVTGYPTGAAFTKFDGLFQTYGSQYGVDWKWLKAICMNETMLGTVASVAAGLRDPNDEASVSDDGKSWGLMQFTLPTAQDYEDVTWQDLNDPEISIRLGAKFVHDLIGQFPAPYDTERCVIMSYNQGATATKNGKTYAAEYYARWQRNLAHINKVQP